VVPGNLGTFDVPLSDPKPGQCDGPVACYAGACKKKDGVSCSANSECGNVCIQGTCAPVSGVHGACDYDDPPTDDGRNPDCAPELFCYANRCITPEELREIRF
jgi:hypothetical protein